MNKTDWKKPTTIAVIIFVLTFGFFLSQEASAETSYELAPATHFVAGKKYQGGTLFIVEKVNDRKYQIGLLVQTGLNCLSNCYRGSSGQNQAIFIQRYTYYGKFKLGFGISYWHKQTPAWNSHTPYALTIGYDFSDTFGVNWRHFSTAGSSDSNGGLDMITLEINF